MAGRIRERKDRGTWTADLVADGQRPRRSFKTRAEAEKWLREQRTIQEPGEEALAPSPLGSAPPDAADREELPPWLVEGIQPMEDVMKADYERQGVSEFYEQQIPKN